MDIGERMKGIRKGNESVSTMLGSSASGSGQKAGNMGAFDPCVHFPATMEDRRKIENAMWEGWELLVDQDTNEVWIGDREELIAKIGGRKE